MNVQGYSFVPAAGYPQQQGPAAQPPLPAPEPQATGQQGMQAWGGAGAQQAGQPGWNTQQQNPGMGQEQWQQHQQMMMMAQQQQQMMMAQQMQQQQQWQAQQQQQQMQQQMMAQQMQQQQQQPQQQSWGQGSSGSSNWRQEWHQQLQREAMQRQQQQMLQQQQWQQCQQGMGMQQPFGMGAMQQPMGGMQQPNMYNQQQYAYNQQQGVPMQQAGPMSNPQAQMQQLQQQPQQQGMMAQSPQGMQAMNPQQAWTGMQQQGPVSQQGAFNQPQQMQQQPGMPAAMPNALNAGPGAAPGGPYGMNGGAAPAGMMQQQAPPQGPSPPTPAPAAALPARPPSPPKPLDLLDLLQPPGRDSRPKRLLVLLRGPAGCGKSHCAKAIRQLEASAGGAPPRVHSMDDYFMVEVEQQGDAAGGSSSSSKRRGGSAAVTVQEYQYDAQLEPSYWRSLLRVVTKTLSDGLHPLVLLDAPALKAEQVREVWQAAQGAGAELLVVNPLTTDPEVCFKQNVHKHTLEFIQGQVKAFEPAPATFTSADAASLFGDRKAKEGGTAASPSKQGGGPKAAAAASATAISEVDMVVDDEPTAAAGDGDAGVDADADAAEPGGTPEPLGGLGSRLNGRLGAKASRWEDDSSDEEGDLPQRGTAAAAAGVAAAGGSSDQGRGGGSSAAADDDGGDAGAARPRKKARFAEGLALDAFDAESLLAGVNQELELLDAAEGMSGTPAGAAAAAAGGMTAGRMGSGGMGSGFSIGAGNSSGSGGRPASILKKSGTPDSRSKKVRVRWPDLADQQEEEQQGFRIAAPVRQVRAEHRAEHDLFRAVLLGHNSPKGNAGSHTPTGAAAGSSGSMLFMHPK